MTEQPKKSMYDTGYFDDEESAKEVSTRARRTATASKSPHKNRPSKPGSRERSFDAHSVGRKTTSSSAAV